MKTIDTRGKLCPQPLIMTKRAIAQGAPGDEFEVLTDNATACSNLRTYLNELGIAFRDDDGTIRFTLSSGHPAAGEKQPDPACPAVPQRITGDYCVAIGSDRMGRGDDRLGAVLLRAFVNSLTEAERLPSHIVLYNSGIHLALQGADTAGTLDELQQRGVRILACGTCLDFYEVKDRLAVGTVSNMFRITEVLSHAGHIVYP